LISNCTFGQIDSISISLIESKIRSLQPSGTIYYGESVPAFIQKQIRDLEWSKYLQDRLLYCENLGFTISRDDLKDFKRVFRKVVKQRNPDGIFRDSKRLPYDSLSKVVRERNRAILDSMRLLTADKRPDVRILNWEFYFTEPIYNKSRTLMMIFFMYYYSSGGESAFYITKPGASSMDNSCRFGGSAW
jgi:hypothetical protein